ncbi:MAG: hypothetical protein ACE368_12640 [Paracoccaceae bacterium]
MSESPLVRRGIPVEVETVIAADLDLVLLGLGDDFLESASHVLAELPVCREDVVEGAVRIRAHRDHDLAFIVGRMDAAVVVTIMRIWPTLERSEMLETLKAVEILAMLRGASGL